MDEPNAQRVDRDSYFKEFARIEQRGSADDRYCPECKKHVTLGMFLAHDNKGDVQGCIQCTQCHTTWVANPALGIKLGILPGDDESAVDFDALKDF